MWMCSQHTSVIKFDDSWGFYMLYSFPNLNLNPRDRENEAECMRALTVVPYLRNEADVDVAEVLPLHFELKLPEGLDEGHALDVAHRASQLLTQNTGSDHSKSPKLLT